MEIDHSSPNNKAKEVKPLEKNNLTKWNASNMLLFDGREKRRNPIDGDRK